MAEGHRRHYARFLDALPSGDLHFTAHSHHPWPDVTRDAVVACWDDAARLADDKWDHILGDVVPRAQRHVARVLGLSRPEQIAFAPNTHELVSRLWSAIEPEVRRGTIRILTTDGEFRSFERQLLRWEELDHVEVDRVPVAPFESFESRFAAALRDGAYDLAYLSHVFYDSAWVVRDLERIAGAARDDTLLVVDGYHAVLALPVGLARLETRVFYLAGGYKYAQSGEGAAFAAVPPGFRGRPVDTGWYADDPTAVDRAVPGGRVGYPDDGGRLAGATFDATGLYRLNATLDLLEREGLDVDRIHAWVRDLQRRFLDGLVERPDARRRLGRWCAPPGPDPLASTGHFLAFDCDDAPKRVAWLRERGVRVDARRGRVRIGFGLYHRRADVDALLDRL